MEAQTVGGIAGTVSGGIILILREAITAWNNHKDGGYATIQNVGDAIKESEEKAKIIAVNLEEKQKEVAMELKQKADSQDIKISLLEHQKDCLDKQRSDFKEFQANLLLIVAKLQEITHDGFSRVHGRVDDLVRSVGHLTEDVAALKAIKE